MWWDGRPAFRRRVSSRVQGLDPWGRALEVPGISATCGSSLKGMEMGWEQRLRPPQLQEDQNEEGHG